VTDRRTDGWREKGREEQTDRLREGCTNGGKVRWRDGLRDGRRDGLRDRLEVRHRDLSRDGQ
jgi:hypothetical protein